MRDVGGGVGELASVKRGVYDVIRVPFTLLE